MPFQFFCRFCSWQANTAERDAKYLLKHLELLARDNLSINKREVFQRCKGHFTASEEAENALLVLQERGYLTVLTVKSGGPGRPSEVIRMNPEFLEPSFK